MGKREQIIYIFFVVVVTAGNTSFIKFEDLFSVAIAPSH